MESEELRQGLREAERAAAAPYVDYPRTPPWYYPTVGLWCAALVLVLSIPHGNAVRAVGLLVLVGLEVAFVAWYRSYRGTMPSMRHVPAEIGRAMLGYVVGTVVVVAVVLAAAVWVSPWLASGLALVLVTAGLAVYERHYERAAAATRARLS